MGNLDVHVVFGERAGRVFVQLEVRPFILREASEAFECLGVAHDEGIGLDGNNSLNRILYRCNEGQSPSFGPLQEFALGSTFAPFMVILLPDEIT
jgi:hypothetical protein